MSRRLHYVSLALLLCAVALSACVFRRWSAPEYVRVKGTEFQIAGQPYRFVGVNYWYAAVLGRSDAAGDRARLQRELDVLAKLGLKNLRLLALSERSSATTMNEFAQDRPGEFSEAWMDGLDFALAEMDKRGMKAVIYLNNYWNWSGGMGQYHSWSSGTPVTRDDAGWPERNRYATQFYSDAKARELFDRAVEHLVNRRNRYSGRAYRDDPTIMAWQLCNEARPGTNEQTAEVRDVMLEWITHSSHHLRSLGVRQLISSGCEGVFGANGDIALYESIHALPDIDYLTAHLWPENWRWYDPKRPEETLPQTLERSRAFLEQHAEIARRVGKPLVLEEFGFARDGGRFDGQGSTQNRDRFLEMIGAFWASGAANGSPLQGFNLWTWGGEATPRDNSGSFWHPGMPVTGDNPNEPQGWYNVSEADRSTVDLLAKFAAQAGAVKRE